MAQRSPTAEGFRTIIRTPSLWLAEIAWRWSFGLSTGLLLCLVGFEFLRSVKVSDADMLFLRSANPALLGAALADLLEAGMPRLLRIAALLVPVVALLWVLASALGRAATLGFMLTNARVRIRALLGLSFLRAALSVSALAALIGTATLPRKHTGAAEAAAVGAALAILMLWSFLGWLLTLAAVPAGTGEDTLSAIASSARLFRRRAGAFAATGTWFGLMRLAVTVGAGVAALFAVSLASISGWAALVALAVVAAGYFAVVDFFYIARLAAYVAIAEDEASPSEPVSLPAAPFPGIPPAATAPEATA